MAVEGYNAAEVETIVNWLGLMSVAEYETKRRAIADALGWRALILDRLVKQVATRRLST